MNRPVYPEFKPVGLEDQALLKGYLDREPSGVCEMNFANIFIWKDSEHPSYTILDGSLCILVEPDFEPPYFLPPVGGDRVPETIGTCLRHAPRLSRVPEEFVRRFGAGFRAEENPDNFDYIYRVEDLVELKGKKYDGKRNRIRKFESSFRHEYLPLAREDAPECGVLLQSWFEEKRNGDPYMKAEKVAIIQALASFELVGLKGGVVKVDGRIEAFTFGMRLTADTVVIPIEIANPAFPGLAQWINREFVRREWPDYKFVNREQDMGVPGLRVAKLSYQPAGLIKKSDLFGRP